MAIAGDGWELVIFDNDGVLVDSERIANAVLADLLTGLGHPTTVAESIDRYLGGTIGRARQLVEDAAGTSLPADFEDRYHAELFARFPRELTAVRGAAAAVDAVVAAGVPVCVASSGEPDRIRRSLSLTGLAERFTGRVYSAAEVAHGKPAPDLFLHAAASMGADPARTAVIEDSPLGVAAAGAAGMTAFGYCRLTPCTRLAAAHTTFRDMAELPKLLGLLRERCQP
ncbi:MAG TPA: HAD-IA family hydrolase [Acidimicrobiales bacterium]|nr:HAD-IA family hydrolase [Acidimicrobiales bacterium]